MTKRTLGFCTAIMLVVAVIFLSGPSLLGRISHDGSLVTIHTVASRMAFTSNKELVTAKAERIRHWNIQTGQLIREDQTQVRYPDTFLANGRFLSGGYEDKLTQLSFHILWNVSNNTLERSVERPRTSLFTQKTFSPDGKMVATVWVKKMPHFGKSRDPQDFQYVLTMQESKTGRRLWQVDGGDYVASNKCLIAFSPDSQYIVKQTVFFSGAAGIRGTPGVKIKLCDARTGSELKTLAWDIQSATDNLGWRNITFSPDGSRLGAIGGPETSYVDNGHVTNIYLWDVKTGQLCWKQDGWDKRNEVPQDIIFSPDGKQLAASCLVFRRFNRFVGGIVHLWDVESGQLLRTISHETLPDRYANRLDENVRDIREAFPGNQSKRRGRLPSDKSFPIRALAFSPDSKLLATSDESGVVKVWSVR